MIELSLWFLFPVALAISAIAMMSGIGGAVLFSPFFILVLKLDPLHAITLGLIVEVFGFASGLSGYLRRELVRFDIVHKLIAYVILGSAIGIIIRSYISEVVLTLMLTIMIFIIAYLFLRSKKICVPKHPSHPHHKDEKYEEVEIDKSVKATTFLGSFMVGTTASGLGEVNEYNFNEKLEIPFSYSSGTSVFLIAIAAIISSIPHLILAFNGADKLFLDFASILFFAIPGVVVGAQIGVSVSKRVKFEFIEHVMGSLFLLIGFILFLSLIM